MGTRTWRWRLAALAGLLLAALPQLASAAGRPAAAARPTYYLALGDSLATGYQPGFTSRQFPVPGCGFAGGYACDLYSALETQNPTLQAVNLSCPGETTTSMLTGAGSPCYVHGPSQLQRAARFLQAHHGQVALVTLDIGANNVDGCVSSSGVNPTCVGDGLYAVQEQLPVILAVLSHAAGPGVPIVGMNYYDPFLAAYLLGTSAGVALAYQSEGLTVLFNRLLGGIYGAFGDPVADVQSTFETTVFTSYGGTDIPTNVVIICQWTWMCTEHPNIHANNTGYAAIAGSFELVPVVASLLR